jgi:hypothetical protein
MFRPIQISVFQEARPMAEPIVSVSALLRQAADALEAAYKDRADVPAAVLALVAALRDRSEPTAATVTPEQPDPEASTVTQDEP